MEHKQHNLNSTLINGKTIIIEIGRENATYNIDNMKNREHCV